MVRSRKRLARFVLEVEGSDDPNFEEERYMIERRKVAILKQMLMQESSCSGDMRRRTASDMHLLNSGGPRLVVRRS